ncbi:hypothetical protein SCHPADRAFT_875550 [Schizopora paradoxa]|uniref:Uncharacterized protein n=1 Tax=Schizopora paradoxa TaxID=27342 RepID=A0A0H2RKH2_9AGAM|nr:hypothetical protein SCHPADRAFT_875550 [Schizopora paradoxa]
MTRFGDFEPLCHHVPSYPWCNLFYRQLLKSDPSQLTGLSADRSSAPVGIDPTCGIPLVNKDGSLGNIANIIACGLSMLVVAWLVLSTGRRKAAVGRAELQIFLIIYFFTLPFQLLTTGSVLEQGTTGLVVLTAIHAGLLAALFWSLFANAIVATQVVEDGTLSSLIPFNIFNVLFFVATTYISLDVALHISNAFGPSNPPQSLNSVPLFVLTSVWPAAAAFIYFVLMAYIVLGILRERRPMLFFGFAAVLFILSQLDYFLLSKVICKSNDKVDGSFIATILETASVVVIYFGWISITEEDWEDDNNRYP